MYTATPSGPDKTADIGVIGLAAQPSLVTLEYAHSLTYLSSSGFLLSKKTQRYIVIATLKKGFKEMGISPTFLRGIKYLYTLECATSLDKASPTPSSCILLLNSAGRNEFAYNILQTPHAIYLIVSDPTMFCLTLCVLFLVLDVRTHPST